MNFRQRSVTDPRRGDLFFFHPIKDENLNFTKDYRKGKNLPYNNRHRFVGLEKTSDFISFPEPNPELIN